MKNKPLNKGIFSVSEHLKLLVLRFKAANDKSSKDKVDNYLIIAALMPILMKCFMLVAIAPAVYLIFFCNRNCNFH